VRDKAPPEVEGGGTTEQDALRRVATLVAQESPPVEIFVAVTQEAARVLQTDAAGLLRFESDSATLVAQSDTPWDPPPLGTRFPLDGDNVVTEVFHSGEAARDDDWADATGAVAQMASVLGVRSAVASPVIVGDRLWGVIIAATARSEPLAADMERRLAQFTDLVGTAVANAEAREALARLVDEQAALRRVATLVAQQPSTEEIFELVSSEVARVFGFDSDPASPDIAGVVKFEPGPTLVPVGASKLGEAVKLGARFPPDELYVSSHVLRTARSARVGVEDLDSVGGETADWFRRYGLLSQVGSPIIVQGRLWGAMTVNSGEDLPGDTEQRLERFTELLATAIANAETSDARTLLAEEQAALRRVATLVADGVGPEGVFPAVAAEVDTLFGADVSAIVKFEADGEATVLGDVGGPHMSGKRVTLDPGYVVDVVRETRRSARFDTDDPAAEGMPSIVRAVGIRSAVASPIVVDGAVWGAITAASVEGPLPPAAERRLSEFTELIATAVSNAQAHEAVRAGAEEQGALRRVATLVAAAAPPSEVFAAVTREAALVLGANACLLCREDDDGVVVVGTWADNEAAAPPGFRIPRGGRNLTSIVLDTGKPARLDDYENASGDAAEVAHSQGVRSAVGAPIIVEGRLWGLVIAGRAGDEPLPSGAENRLAAFTELVATAIANTESSQALERVAAEQAALRRVATLVADQADPGVIFASVAEEVARTVAGERCAIGRLEGDDALTVVAYWSEEEQKVPVGASFDVANDEVVAAVRESGRLLRIDDHEAFSGPLVDYARSMGSLPSSTVAAPVFVGGSIWGIMFTSTMASVLPEGAESRITNFAELVSTALSNAQARSDVQRLAEDQTALRRVATLIARQQPPEEIFAAVTEAAGSLLGADVTGIVEVLDEVTGMLVAGWSPGVPTVPVGLRLPLDEDGVTARVVHTAAPARIDESGPDASSALAGTLGVTSSVGAPIQVGGKLWGVLGASVRGDTPLPEDAESRLAAFTELVATAIVNAESSQAVERAAAEQAALRHVATLVAVDAPQDEIFTAIATGVAGALGEELRLVRYERGDALVVASSDGPHLDVLPVGTRLPVGGNNALSQVFRTGESVRIDDYSTATGPIAEAVQQKGLRSIVATPVVVGGRTWGAMIVGTFGDDPVPPGTEDRLDQFVELMATSIANTEARAEIERLVRQEAALRRLATLVAEGAEPERVFAAVTEETAAAFDAITAVMRFEHDPPHNVIVGVSKETDIPIGTRWPLAEGMTSTEVYRTGKPARLGSVDWPAHPGPVAEAGVRFGVASQVACPIVVEGSLWGVITLNSAEELPPDTERRLERFTELVTTAIANATNRDELLASRARIVAAGDEARRRIERDLHDGTQQRLIALGLDLQRARADLPDDQRGARWALTRAEDDLDAILVDLRELSHGLHPPLLSRLGLGPSLQALARRSPIPVEVDVDLPERPPESLETAVYYVVSEALTNAIKHSRASVITVRIASRDGLQVSIADDGIGGADASVGSGLTGLFDRVDALGGQFECDSPPQGGTKISVALPPAS
jgi:GAF domain-containing protein